MFYTQKKCSQNWKHSLYLSKNMNLKKSSPSWARTNNPTVNSRVLYHWAIEEYVNYNNTIGNGCQYLQINILPKLFRFYRLIFLWLTLILYITHVLKSIVLNHTTLHYYEHLLGIYTHNKIIFIYVYLSYFLYIIIFLFF